LGEGHFRQHASIIFIALVKKLYLGKEMSDNTMKGIAVLRNYVISLILFINFFINY